MRQEQKEQFLLYRIRAFRDQHAFAEIHRTYAKSVHRFLRIKLPSKPDVDDALSTTFVRLWNYVSTSEVEHVSGLVFTIARGVVAEFYRSRKEEVSLSQDRDEEGGVLPDDEGKGAEKMITDVDAALVRQALQELTDDAREAIILRYLEGQPISKVAKHLNKSDNATRVFIHRAIKDLRERLKTK